MKGGIKRAIQGLGYNQAKTKDSGTKVIAVPGATAPTTTTPTTTATTPVSNKGTQDYINGMKWAYSTDEGRQMLADALKDSVNSGANTQGSVADAHKDINEYYKNKNNALTSHYNSDTNKDGTGTAYGVTGITDAGNDAGDNGDNGGNGGNGRVTVSLGSGSGLGSSITSTPTTQEPTPVVPDTTVEDAYKAQLEATNERLKHAYEYQQSILQQAKDNALREAYIKQQMVERGYPEQLAAAGIRGGAAQGVLARNNADYAKQRTAAYNNFLTGLATAGQNYQQGILSSNENYLASMAAYQQALKQMELQHQYDKELATLKASLA